MSAQCGMGMCDAWTGHGCYCDFMGLFDDDADAPGEPE